MPTFVHAGQRLAYEVYGEGARNVVLLPGLLFPSRMHEPLARDLADRGHRVITLDLLGHGESDKPRDMWRYSIPIFGREVVALLDHLELDEAVIGGTSLGANTTLEIVSLAPNRVRGMVIEMPVLDNALLACAVAFTPLLDRAHLRRAGRRSRRVGAAPRAARVRPLPGRLPGRAEP